MSDASPPDAIGATEGRPLRPHYSGVDHKAIAAGMALFVAALAGGGWWWWQQERASPPPTSPPVPVAAAPAPAEAPAVPAIGHPIDVPADAAASSQAPSNPDAAIKAALTALLGTQPVATWLQTDGFVRRAVATVDNLGRAHAAPLLWPVVPTPGRFTVERGSDGERVAPSNAARYDAFVALATSIDVRRAAALYKSMYPQFQSTYQELGYPRGYFNDRLVVVIDQLLATPEPAEPPAVRLTEVKGPLASDRPWVRYEFADPALEALPAGSKMLLRMGNAHARALKAQLRAFRAEIARKA